ncbi:MAG: GNAT family N-acetyltransferase [Kofleriaceae bacterium]
MTGAPDLDTARLTLRAHRREDLDECAAMWADPAVTRYINGGIPVARSDVWARLLRYVGHWSIMGYGFWAVREKESGKFVGEVGFADFQREIGQGLDGLPEIGWALATWAHGRGFASELVRTVVAWGDQHLKAVRSICMIAPGNLASIRVAQKCGYREFMRVTYRGEPVALFDRRVSR